MSCRRQCGSLLTRMATFFFLRSNADERALPCRCLPSQFKQAGDEIRQGRGEVFEIDQHIHDEEPADHALLDVFDIDAALGHVGGELRDHPFLIFPRTLTTANTG